MNLYKDINSGEKAPEEIKVVIEIPKGSSNKYEYNEEGGYMELDRVIYSPLFYPLDYGFMPQTLSEDGDSLDILMLGTYPTIPECVAKVRPIGVFLMEDEAGIDPKVLVAPTVKNDPRFKEIKDIGDVPEHIKKEVEEFFKVIKNLEPGKFVNSKGWGDKKEAEKIITEAIERYKNEN